MAQTLSQPCLHFPNITVASNMVESPNLPVTSYSLNLLKHDIVKMMKYCVARKLVKVNIHEVYFVEVIDYLLMES